MASQKRLPNDNRFVGMDQYENGKSLNLIAIYIYLLYCIWSEAEYP